MKGGEWFPAGLISALKRETLRQSTACKIGLEIEPSQTTRDHIFAKLSFC